MSSYEYKNCPYCDEVIKINAIKCKHCFSDLSDEKPIEKDFVKVPSMNRIINKLSIKNPVLIGLLVLIVIAAILLLTSKNGASPIEDVSSSIYNAGLAIIEDFDNASVRTRAVQEMLDGSDKSADETKEVISFQHKIDELKNKARTEEELAYVAVVQDIFDIQKQLVTFEMMKVVAEDYYIDASDMAQVVASDYLFEMIKELQEEKSTLFSESFYLIKNATSIEDIVNIKRLIQSSN